MYTNTKLKKSPAVLHDKYQTANPGRQIENRQTDVVPLEYRWLHDHVSTQAVSRNTTTSFELFTFVDEKTQANLRSLTYSQRVQTYQNLVKLIGEWWKYDVSIIHSLEKDGSMHSNEAGPTIQLIWEQVPLAQIIREKIREIYTKLMPNR